MSASNNRNYKKTRANPLKIEVVIDSLENIKLTNDFFGAIFQYPGKHGKVFNYKDIVSAAKSLDIGIVFGADLLSLTMLTPQENGVQML